METVYKCVKEFSVSVFDENGELIEGEFVEILLNTTWEHVKDSYSTSDIRLVGDSCWIDICKETLARCFVEI